MEGTTVRLRIFKNHPAGHPARLTLAYRVLRAQRTVRLVWIGPFIIMLGTGR